MIVLKNISKILMLKLIFACNKIALCFLVALILPNIFPPAPVFASTSAITAVSVTGYTFPDGSGNATLNNSTPQLIIISTEEALTVMAESGTLEPSINAGLFCSNGTVTLPAINVVSNNAYDVVLSIYDSTAVARDKSNWNCVINLPVVTNITLPEVSGETRTLEAAVEMGVSNGKLSFSRAIRILFPNQADNRVGYSRAETDFTEIMSVCASDSQTAGDALDADGDCKINVGNDLIVWTKHFTKFAVFSSVASSGSSSSSSSSRHTGRKTANNNVPITTAPRITTAPTSVFESSPAAEKKLFDIALSIESALLDKSSDLIARTQFTNFGTVLTSVSLNYRIEDAFGKIVFSEKDETTVQTEQLVVKKFDNFSAGSGKYTLILTTIYGDNVKDEFKQNFEVKEASAKIAWIWIVLIMATTGIIGFILFRFIKWAKNKWQNEI